MWVNVSLIIPTRAWQRVALLADGVTIFTYGMFASLYLAVVKSFLEINSFMVLNLSERGMLGAISVALGTLLSFSPAHATTSGPGTTEASDAVCASLQPTIYVSNGRIVGGAHDGRWYRGLLKGTGGDDIIFGTDLSDRISALGGDDIVCTFGGNDRIFGGSGSDTLYSGSGKDSVFGQSGADTLVGGSGNDRLLGHAGNDTLDGGLGQIYRDTQNKS